MNLLLSLVVISASIILALAIIGSTILMGIKMLKEGVSRKGQRFESEEARMMQEIYHGLSKMEERLEALETIILDRDRKD